MHGYNSSCSSSLVWNREGKREGKRQLVQLGRGLISPFSRPLLLCSRLVELKLFVAADWLAGSATYMGIQTKIAVSHIDEKVGTR